MRIRYSVYTVSSDVISSTSSPLQIILFVCGSQKRVKSVCVYEPAPRFCRRLFIMDRNRYSAGKDHLLKKNQPDTKTNSAKKKEFIPNCRCIESQLLKCVLVALLCD